MLLLCLSPALLVAPGRSRACLAEPLSAALRPVRDALNSPKQARRTSSGTDTKVVNERCHRARATASPYSPPGWAGL